MPLPEKDQILPSTAVDREFECQVCLDRFSKPVLMPCQVHSVCLECLYEIYKKKKSENNRKSINLKIECPTCGQSAGQAKFKDLKINKELTKIMEAYKIEKQEIFARKEKNKEDQIEIVTSKEEKIKSLLNNAHPEQIKNIAYKALKELIDRGNNIETIIDTIHIKLNPPNKINKYWENSMILYFLVY